MGLLLWTADLYLVLGIDSRRVGDAGARNCALVDVAVLTLVASMVAAVNAGRYVTRLRGCYITIRKVC